MDLTIRRADPADTSAVQRAYRSIVEHLARTVDYPHWHTENHPTPEEVRGWVAAGEMHVARVGGGDPLDGTANIAGVMVLNREAPDEYRAAAWAVDAEEDEILIVHALGVTPGHQGRGVARAMVDAAVETARVRGCRAVRLDTYVENLPALELYRRYGFTDLGAHTVHYPGTALDRFHLFEYVL